MSEAMVPKCICDMNDPPRGYGWMFRCLAHPEAGSIATAITRVGLSETFVLVDDPEGIAYADLFSGYKIIT